MKAVIAIDSFKGSLTSLEAGKSAADGILRVFPDAECVIRPLADGGEGTVDALITACGRPLRQPGHLPLWSDHTNTDRHY